MHNINHAVISRVTRTRSVFQGGIKAVVWTDTLQMFLMLFGVFYIAIAGTMKAGGIKSVYEKNLETDRLEFFE